MLSVRLLVAAAVLGLAWQGSPVRAAKEAPPTDDNALPWTYRDWRHDWTNMTQQMWVDFAGKSYRDMPTTEQWDFIARNYAIVSLEKCFAGGAFPRRTEDAVIAGARALKQVNPHIAVLNYFHTEVCFADCYQYGVRWEANTQWHLKGDDGVILYKYTPRRTFYNYTDPTVRSFVVNATARPTGVSAADLGLLDGVFGDGVTKMPVSSKVGAARRAVWSTHHIATVNASRVAMHATYGAAAPGATPPPPGTPARKPLYVGNSFFFYPQNPTYGVNTLPVQDGTCLEHFISFEMLNGQAQPRISLFDQAIQMIEDATLTRKMPVLVRGFPGPMAGPICAQGPSFNANSGLPQPSCSGATGFTQRAAWARYFLVPVLAGYLVAANERTYFSYNWWYTAPDGIYPCPTGECSAPSDWYPELTRNIGPPLGRYSKTTSGGRVVYRRRFRNANVTFDASNISRSVIDWAPASFHPPPTRSVSQTQTPVTPPTRTATPSLRVDDDVSAWAHDWEGSIGAQKWVDFFAPNRTRLLSNAELDFVAANYAIVSLEKCFVYGRPNEETTIATAKALKARNPKLRVLWYSNSALCFASCYAYGVNFTAPMELDDDGGTPYVTSGAKYYDHSKPHVRQFYAVDATAGVFDSARWGTVCNTSSTGGASNNAHAPATACVFDGVFADKANTNVPLAFNRSPLSMSPARIAAYEAGHRAALAEASPLLKRRVAGAPSSTPGGATTAQPPVGALLGNTFHARRYDDIAPLRAANAETLRYLDEARLDGGCFEHFNAISMLAGNGTLSPIRFQAALELVGEVSARRKITLVRLWPGPVDSRAITVKGPSYSAGSGFATPTTYEGRAAALSQWLEPALAGYLMVASNWTYLDYSWWYGLQDGVTPCCDGSCSGPCGWYPLLKRRTGAPIGLAHRVDGDVGRAWVFRREFEHCTVWFDAVAMERSRIVFRRTDSATVSRSASTPLPTPQPTAAMTPQSTPQPTPEPQSSPQPTPDQQCRWTCATPCAHCLGREVDAATNTQRVTIDFARCKSGDTISWAACRDSACSLERCVAGTASPELQKCDETTGASFLAPLSQQTLTIQTHDGQTHGNVSCRGVGLGDGQCSGGSGTSCDGAVSGVCDQVVDLSTCPGSITTLAPGTTETPGPTEDESARAGANNSTGDGSGSTEQAPCRLFKLHCWVVYLAATGVVLLMVGVVVLRYINHRNDLQRRIDALKAKEEMEAAGPTGDDAEAMRPVSGAGSSPADARRKQSVSFAPVGPGDGAGDGDDIVSADASVLLGTGRLFVTSTRVNPACGVNPLSDAPSSARITVEDFSDHDERNASALPGASASGSDGLAVGAVVRRLSRSAVALTIDSVPGSPTKKAE